MRRMLYYVTLPFFTAAFYLMQGFEGLCWVVQSPRDAWNYVKQALGLVK
jgi:hypothetical protein